MELLGIQHAFSSDAIGLTLGLTGVSALLIFIFLRQSFKKASVDGGVRSTREGTTYDNNPNPWYKQTQSYFAGGVLLLWVIALIIVGSDYAPYDPDKHGVPKEQTDTTRLPAEDFHK